MRRAAGDQPPDSPASPPTEPTAVPPIVRRDPTKPTRITRPRRPQPPIEETPAEPEPALIDESPPSELQRPRMPVPEPPSELSDEEKYQQALQIQRVRRNQRRRARRRQRTEGFFGGFFRTTILSLLAAGLFATILTWFTDPQFLNPSVASGLQIADATSQSTAAPTSMPTPNWFRKIGIVSGHKGPENDPGAVCEDGLTEAEINFAVAQLVVRNLRELGYSVDLLDEFDPRLNDFRAEALISIHANTCQDFGEFVSGYLVAKAAARPEGGLDTRLAECIAQHYGQATLLERRTTLTLDMTDYHTFGEIHPLTPASIIELGFMKDDRQLLTEQQDVLASGITDGILCFLQPAGNGLPAPPATEAPSTTPTPQA